LASWRTAPSKKGYALPSDEIVFFEALKEGSAFYDLDYVPEFITPGKRYQFRIPAEMVEWKKKK
jgi:hypothetical protein